MFAFFVIAAVITAICMAIAFPMGALGLAALVFIVSKF